MLKTREERRCNCKWWAIGCDNKGMWRTKICDKNELRTNEATASSRNLQEQIRTRRNEPLRRLRMTLRRPENYTYRALSLSFVDVFFVHQWQQADKICRSEFGSTWLLVVGLRGYLLLWGVRQCRPAASDLRRSLILSEYSINHFPWLKINSNQSCVLVLSTVL
jgi:hypothetical protein